jgi:hypothetical protein
MKTENAPPTLPFVDGMLPFDDLVAAQNGDDLLLEYREPQVIGYATNCGDSCSWSIRLTENARKSLHRLSPIAAAALADATSRRPHIIEL